MQINVFEVIGKPIAMSTDDGRKLYEAIKDALIKDKYVELSFKNIDMLISHFLNEAIGNLYKHFEDWDNLDNSLKFLDMKESDLELLLNKVIPASKNHFKDVEKSEKIQNDVLKG